MKLYAPENYLSFACIADRCRHTCCAGWEIDIDPETLARYRALPGALGEALRQGICEDGTGAHFRLDERERCPMLDAQGLCRVILQGGEGLLCQICRDHPRFRSFFSDRTEIGLGLCCEEAARQLLFREEPMRLVLLGEDDAPEAPLSEAETELLDDRTDLMAALQDRTLPLPERLARLLPLEEPTPAAWAEELTQLEQLDPAGSALLRALATAEALPTVDPAFDPCFEQLGWYLLYRHLPGGLEDDLWEERAALCLLLVGLARQLFALGAQTPERLTDIVRLMSSELEYSDENIPALLEWIMPTQNGSLS